MPTDPLLKLSRAALKRLCVEIPDRSVGSRGNRRAVRFFERQLDRLGWETERQEFTAVDWFDGRASLTAGGEPFTVQASPYSNGCQVEAPLAPVSSLDELEKAEISGQVVLLHGEIAREQLMPKNFVFYNPEEHQRIIALLEQKAPAAVLCATGRNPALAGGVYPFPLIEDGDFDIPSLYLTEEEGRRLLPFAGQTAQVKSGARRIPGKGSNVIGRQGDPAGGRIAVTAHIDAKKGTPGAIDNATGVTVLLLLAGLLADYHGPRQVEMIALNGEDYYAVPGQMLYLQSNQGRFHEILLNINIDGGGYHAGKSAVSFYGLPPGLEQKFRSVLAGFEGITEGSQWVQGDHSIFVQNGCPAVAVTSSWFSENMDSQDITHTPRDAFAIVDCAKLVEIARALQGMIASL